MGSKKLALEAGGPPRLELAWGMGWKQFTVTLDGKAVGTVEGGASELKKGAKFRLPDGSMLDIKLESGVLRTALSVLRDGVAVPGSDTDPAQQVRSAAHLLYFVAGLNVLLGLLAEVGQVEALVQLGMGVFSILFGVVSAVLGYFTSRGAKAAPMIAGILFIGDAFLSVADATMSGGRPSIPGLIFRAYIVITLFTASKAAGELKRREQSGAGVSLQP